MNNINKNIEHYKTVRKYIRLHKKQAFKCLYPENDYAWGTTKQNLKKTLDLMNSLLREVPECLWPKDSEDNIRIRDGNWILDLMFLDKKRHANLRYSKDDHTAWVVEKRGGGFKDFDIGGS